MFDKKILKCKGEKSSRIINLKGGETLDDRIQQIISKRVTKDIKILIYFIIYLFFIYLLINLFIYLLTYLFIYLFEVNFFHPKRDRMLNLHMSAFLVAKVPFSVSTFLSLR